MISTHRESDRTVLAKKNTLALITFAVSGPVLIAAIGLDAFPWGPRDVAMICAVLTTSTFVQSALGFGNGLVAIPLLAQLMPLVMAIPVVTLTGACISGIVLLRDWQAVDTKATKRLLVSACAGVPIGLFALHSVSEVTLRLGLGFLLMGLSVARLAGWRFPAMRGPYPVWIAGFAAGILGGAYNMSGPPVVVYGTMRNWSPLTFRASVLGFFLPLALVVLAGQAASEMWTLKVVAGFSSGTPAIALGTTLGILVGDKIEPERFSVIVYVAIGAMGLILFL